MVAISSVKERTGRVDDQMSRITPNTPASPENLSGMPSAADTQSAMTGAHRGLECIIGRWRFGVPVESVQQVVDLDIGRPPPLARAWVRGVGLHEGRAIVSIALFPSLGGGQRQAKGIWLAADGAPTTYVLEVNRVGTFIDVEVQQQRVVVGKKSLPAFVTAAVTSSRSIGWIHVPSMLRELAGVD
jgi:chemotaxis signal transduction protein